MFLAMLIVNICCGRTTVGLGSEREATIMRRWLFAVALFLILALSWATFWESLPVHFVVPDGFRGEIRLVLDPENGERIRLANGRFTYPILDNGILHVTSFKPLQVYHVQAANYADGSPLLQEFEADEPWTGDKIAFRGGGMSRLNDDPYVITYFVGTAADFEKLSVEQFSDENFSKP